MKKLGLYFLIAVIGSITLSWLAAKDNKSAGIIVTKSQEQPDLKSSKKPLTREQKIDREFSFDGSFMPLVVEVQKQLVDPESFQHIETKVMDRDDNLFITMTYRARNKLGGMVIEQASAVYWPDKNQYEII